MEDALVGMTRGAARPAPAGPTVSCVVPIFNPGEYLCDALDSVVAQQHRPLEIILVDDGSTEPLGEWALAPLVPQARTAIAEGIELSFVRQRNAGPAAARNAGIGLARGALIAFLDQDDRWHAAKLVRQVAHLEARPDVDVSVAHAESVWNDGSDGSREREPDQPRSGAVPGYVSSTMLARRRAFDRVGGFDPAYRYADSLDWFARASERGVVVDLLPEVLLHHRVHAGNLSRRGAASRAECARILKRALDRRRGARGVPA